MKSFNNILVGIDFSEASKQALEQAGRIAREEGGELVALHVIRPSEIEEQMDFYAVSTDGVLDALRDQLVELVEEILGSKAAATCEVAIGIPYDELVRWTEDGGCDLLVLGSRADESNPRDVGFFASKCARHAETPVLLVRQTGGLTFERIVACVDLSEATEEVIQTAERMAADEGATLEVIHAVRPPWMKGSHVLYNTQTVEDDDYKAQYREILEGQLRAAIDSATPGSSIVIGQRLLEHPDRIQSIINFLREHEADLAVVSRRGSTAMELKRFLLGGTAERLIHHSPSSVLVVPGTRPE